jgi:16S rRNA (guanine(966)-N(2))-methyltransferase RsmD
MAIPNSLLNLCVVKVIETSLINKPMRIISGKYKGRRIQPPTNITARPTTDFAKEALFNVLQNRLDFEELLVLDLFSGTGSIGLEFASRGSVGVTCVEMSRVQSQFIRKVSADLKMDNMHLIQGDVFKFIKACSSKFDLIFADPPYQLPTLPTLPDLIFEAGLLKEDGLFILEHSEKNNFESHPHFVDHRNYGSVNFSFFE